MVQFEGPHYIFLRFPGPDPEKRERALEYRAFMPTSGGGMEDVPAVFFASRGRHRVSDNTLSVLKSRRKALQTSLELVQVSTTRYSSEAEHASPSRFTGLQTYSLARNSTAVYSSTCVRNRKRSTDQQDVSPPPGRPERERFDEKIPIYRIDLDTNVPGLEPLF